MALSRARLHNPPTRPPPGPRTAEHVPQTLSALQSVRSAHILRLHALVEHLVSLAPSAQTSVRAVRAWRALCACREVHLSVLWQLGAAVLDRMRESADRGGGDEDDDGEEERWRANRRAEWLRFCQEGTVDRVAKFSEYCLALVAAGRADFALDELDSCVLSLLPSHPCLLLRADPERVRAATSTTSRTTTRSRSTRSTASSRFSSLSLRPSLPRRRPANPQQTPRPTRTRVCRRARTAVRPSASSWTTEPAPTLVRNLFFACTRLRSTMLTWILRAADDYGDLLRATADNSPNLFSKATERFRRAAHLEEREAREAGREAGREPELGEAARWLALVRAHECKGPRRRG